MAASQSPTCRASRRRLDIAQRLDRRQLVCREALPDDPVDGAAVRVAELVRRLVIGGAVRDHLDRLGAAVGGERLVAAPTLRRGSCDQSGGTAGAVTP